VRDQAEQIALLKAAAAAAAATGSAPAPPVRRRRAGGVPRRGEDALRGGGAAEQEGAEEKPQQGPGVAHQAEWGPAGAGGGAPEAAAGEAAGAAAGEAAGAGGGGDEVESLGAEALRALLRSERAAAEAEAEVHQAVADQVRVLSDSLEDLKDVHHDTIEALTTAHDAKKELTAAVRALTNEKTTWQARRPARRPPLRVHAPAGDELCAGGGGRWRSLNGCMWSSLTRTSRWLTSSSKLACCMRKRTWRTWSCGARFRSSAGPSTG
jgi:FtsZ-binding cell division protein ZapB